MRIIGIDPGSRKTGFGIIDVDSGSRKLQHVAHGVLWHVVHDDLTLLEKVCREELAREQAAER